MDGHNRRGTNSQRWPNSRRHRAVFSDITQRQKSEHNIAPMTITEVM